MGVTSYPTNITTVSSDIEAVGGKNATEWMIREDELGNRYALVQLGSDCAAGLGVSLYQGTNPYSLHTGVTANNPAVGFNTTGNNASADDYLWLQIWGKATVQTDGNVDKYERIVIVSGLGLPRAPNSSGSYCAGWALADDYGSDPYWCEIFIQPHGSPS